MTDQAKNKRPKRPRDVNQLGKSIVDMATGQAEQEATKPTTVSDKNPAAVALGRLGGKKGGRARADKLSPEQRSAIAKKAAQKRWLKDDC